MPSSKIVRKEDSDGVVIDFKAKKFPFQVSKPAQDFVSYNSSEPNDFVISEIVAETTGVGAIQRKSLEEQVEQEALARLKEMEEEAYKEAYALGLEEGKQEAYREMSQQLEGQFEAFSKTLDSLNKLKQEMVAFNEAQLIKMVYQMASKVAKKEIEADPELILPLIKDCVTATQQAEDIKVLLNKEDFEFINTIKEKLGRDFDFLDKVELLESEKILKGGCVVETNYGSVDGTIETRINKLWEAVQERLPKSKDQIGE